MVNRLFASKLVALSMSASLALSGCIPVFTPGMPRVSTERTGMTSAEAELNRRSKALQKTIIEGATTGAAAGAALSLANGGSNFWRNVLVGAAVGGLAGSYVASLQKSFTEREDILRQARADIAETNAETRATLRVMRTVKAREIAEINSLRAALAQGRTDSASLEARLSVARANLGDMKGAISGAEARAEDFELAREVIADQGDGANIDSDLALLQRQIQAMRAVASDLEKAI